jgi:hypothetical protein
MIKVLDPLMAEKDTRLRTTVVSTHQERRGVELELFGNTPNLGRRDPRPPFFKRGDLRWLYRSTLGERRNIKAQPCTRVGHDAPNVLKLLHPTPSH